jgi:phosphonate transport system substrate-binding protein
MQESRNRVKIVVVLVLLVLQAATTARAAGQENFYFAVSAMASPAQTLVHFTEFQDYLAEKLGSAVFIKQRRTYDEINELLLTRKIQMAFTCTGGYLSGRKAFGLELLAVPVMKGKIRYRSYIVAAANSPIQSLADLQNLVFALADPLSLTGYIYPMAKVHQLGHNSATFFKKTFFTESHDKSIEAVATGIADGAAVDSLIFDALRVKGDPFASKLKVIDISEEFGMPPVVVPPGVPVELKRKLLKILLTMEKDPAGKRVLNSLGMDRFVLPDPALYRSAVLLRKELDD